MIFVTVGTQLPFDRLVEAVDTWPGLLPGGAFGQVGPGGRPARNFETVPFLAPDRFLALLDEAELVVAHAGMGSIITALTLGKPIVVMPRRHLLGEHRNDHQVATAQRLLLDRGVAVAEDAASMHRFLDRHAAAGAGSAAESARIEKDASRDIVQAIRAFIEGPRELPSSLAPPGPDLL